MGLQEWKCRKNILLFFVGVFLESLVAPSFEIGSLLTDHTTAESRWDLIVVQHEVIDLS